MTDRSKQHCGHECNGEVCYSYRDYQSDDLDPCLAVKCQHDTRTHSAAPDIRMSEAMGNLVRVACEQAKREERERVLDKKNITIIRKRCLHPYWETCGGLNCCQHFVEKTGDCLFDVDAFIESLRGGGAP